MEHTADLLRAIAALAWPAIVLVLLIVYRPDLVRLLGRLRRGKLFGQELEFELDELEKNANAAQELSANLRPALPPAELPRTADQALSLNLLQPALGRAEQRQPDQSPRSAGNLRLLLPTMPEPWRLPSLQDHILEEAAVSPKLALLELSGLLERQVRRILAASQPSANWERQSLLRMTRGLDLPDSLRRAIAQFTDVRNRLIHGHDLDENDALRSIDSGLKILFAIRSIPHEVHVVLVPAVDVYSDPDARERRDIRAVVLETRGVDGSTRRDVFPTRGEYVEGQLLTWEWDMRAEGLPESWYRDPVTGEVLKGMGLLGRVRWPSARRHLIIT